MTISCTPAADASAAAVSAFSWFSWPSDSSTRRRAAVGGSTARPARIAAAMSVELGLTFEAGLSRGASESGDRARSTTGSAPKVMTAA
jgi:hypothetical protein